MKLFNDLTIVDLLIGLFDLLDESSTSDRPVRVTSLALIDGDRIFRRQLDKLRRALEALPPEQRGLPLATLLKQVDGTFDRDGKILRLMQEIIGLLGKPTALAKAAAESVEVLVPFGITKQSYAAEAHHAKTIAPDLARLESALAAVALPDEEVPNLWAVAQRFVASGEELDRLGSTRGETVAARGDRFGAGPLRGRTIGTLHALREHVARALEAREDLPRDLDGKIFGYLDELQRLAQGRAAGAERPADPPAPSPASPVNPTPS